jgi:rare lipoprotein A (peptidoglycan hydrolase)
MYTQKHLIRFAMATFLFVVLMGETSLAKAKGISHKKEEHISHLSKQNKTQSTKRVKLKTDRIKTVLLPRANKLPNLLASSNNNKKITVGMASFYGYESGNRTATGERFKPLGITAAHRTLPLHSNVKVTNLKNNKSVIVTINDRGPYAKGRIIDLSLGAARTIGMTKSGVQKVSIEIL